MDWDFHDPICQILVHFNFSSKEKRVNAKGYRCRYDKPQTPFNRLLKEHILTPEKKARLHQLKAKYSSTELYHSIAKLLKKIVRIQKSYDAAKPRSRGLLLRDLISTLHEPKRSAAPPLIPCPAPCHAALRRGITKGGPGREPRYNRPRLSPQTLSSLRGGAGAASPRCRCFPTSRSLSHAPPRPLAPASSHHTPLNPSARGRLSTATRNPYTQASSLSRREL